jgi:hypothetical protein
MLRPARGALLLTRKRCEDALLLVAVGLGVWQLGSKWNEKALAGGESGWMPMRELADHQNCLY